MFNLRNLGGTLYFKDLPVLEFKFVNNRLKKANVLSDAGIKQHPIFYLFGVSENSIKRVFESRTTPRERQGLEESLKKANLGSYDPERINRYTSSRCIHDNFWLDCDDDKTCWKPENM